MDKKIERCIAGLGSACWFGLWYGYVFGMRCVCTFRIDSTKEEVMKSVN